MHLVHRNRNTLRSPITLLVMFTSVKCPQAGRGQAAGAEATLGGGARHRGRPDTRLGDGAPPTR